MLFAEWWENAILHCPFFSAEQERWALLPEGAQSERSYVLSSMLSACLRYCVPL